ncbi:MAG: hypothetical protein KA322_01600 [Chitinophagales bacterium]|jgi:hypothetical protein|nr:hypothetical protein [Chitinophagales bacterium]
MKNHKHLVFLISISFFISSCIPLDNALDAVCYNKSYYTVDYMSLKVDDKEDIVGSDKPYIINVGFRSKWGQNCSGSTKVMEQEAKGVTPFAQGDRWPFNDKMGLMEYPSIGWQKNNDLANIINRINTDGVTIFGNVAIIIEDDNWPQAVRNQVGPLVANALKVALDEVVSTGGVINEQNIRDKLTTLVATLNIRLRDIIRLAGGAFLNSDDDIIGVDVNLNIDIPDYTLQLLGLNVNDFKVKINIGELAGTAVTAYTETRSNLVQFLGVLVNNILIIPSQGQIEVSLSFGGVPPSAPTSTSISRYNIEKKFTLKNQSGETRAIYTLYGFQGFQCYGTLNPAVPNYTGNQVAIGNGICL